MIFKRIQEDIDSIIARDPAARSRVEVLLCYSGMHALLLHRLAHWLWRRGWPLLARYISNVNRWLTDIEIHPAAEIGRRLFIDHGSGLVIGATSQIGDDVTLYQGVTLGGTKLIAGKRHPTLENGVIVGAGARVLGPITVGEGARIGANAVVLSDVPKGVTMVGIPARPVLRGAKDKEFHAYGLDADLPDPIARALDDLRHEVARLNARLDELENRQPDLDASRGGEESDLPRPRAGGQI